MNYIVLDMEWNQPWPGSPSAKKVLPVQIRGEIIQIGAVRVTEDQEVADEFQIRLADINGRRRTAAIAHPRQVAMYLARKHTEVSLQDIGAAFGGRDHGTVLHAARTIEQKMQDDAELRSVVDRLAAAFA